MTNHISQGPLRGVRLLELAGMGALPFGSLKLADMGAEVIRIDRVGEVPTELVAGAPSAWNRGRQSIAVDLKSPEGLEIVLTLCETADVFCEAFRPGVTERLGLGPDAVLARNPAMIYGRLTGWGQTGPRSSDAGHSLNYEALTGVIRAIGPEGGPPVPLLQVLGDFAGGGLNFAFGVVCGLLEARSSGQGQVIDVAMIDGVMSIVSPFYAMAASGMHSEEMGTNLFDGGAPFYNVYECSDGKYLSVAPIEPHFYQLLIEGLGLTGQELPGQWDQPKWPDLRALLANQIATRTRDEWVEVFRDTDACVAPVLTFTEAQTDEHNVARQSFGDDAAAETTGFGPAPAPRFSRTPGVPQPGYDWVGVHTDEVLAGAGYSEEAIAELRANNVVAG